MKEAPVSLVIVNNKTGEAQKPIRFQYTPAATFEQMKTFAHKGKEYDVVRVERSTKQTTAVVLNMYVNEI